MNEQVFCSYLRWVEYLAITHALQMDKLTWKFLKRKQNPPDFLYVRKFDYFYFLIKKKN